MTTDLSRGAANRTEIRRAAVTDMIVDHAKEILDEDGAGAVTVSEIARRMGMRSPSVYKYFDSLNAIYDALFARGQDLLLAYVHQAVRGLEPGLETLLEGNRAFVRWATGEQGLAALLFWRPVPGFEPSPHTYAVAEELWLEGRRHLREAVARDELSSAADTEEAHRLLTVVVSGIVSQQLANQPGVGFDEGRFTSLTDEVLQMFVHHYTPHHRKDRP